jgi:WD40 repeat protein
MKTRRLRLFLAALAGGLAAFGIWLFWPTSPRAVLPAVLRCEAVFFSPDSRSLVTMHWRQGSDEHEGALVLWDASTGEECRRLFEGAPNYKCIAFSADGAKLAGRDSGRDDQMQVHVWDVATGEKEATYWRQEWRDWGCTPVAFSPQGKVLVFDPYKDAAVEADTGRQVFEFRKRHAIDWSFRSTGHENLVFFAGGKGMWVVDLATGDVRASFAGQDFAKTSGAFGLSPDGTIVVASGGGDLAPHQLYNGRTGEIRPCTAADGMSWLAVSPDGQWLAAGAHVLHDYSGWRRFVPESLRPKHNRYFDVFRLSSGIRSASFPAATSAKFSPDGRTLALIMEDETVQLWDWPMRVPWLIMLAGGVLAAGTGWLLCGLRRGQSRDRQGAVTGTLPDGRGSDNAPIHRSR